MTPIRNLLQRLQISLQMRDGVTWRNLPQRLQISLRRETEQRGEICRVGYRYHSDERRSNVEEFAAEAAEITQVRDGATWRANTLEISNRTDL